MLPATNATKRFAKGPASATATSPPAVALLLGRVVGQHDAADRHEYQNPYRKLTVDGDKSVRDFVDDHREKNEGHQRKAAAIDGVAQRLRVGHPDIRKQKEERQM